MLFQKDEFNQKLDEDPKLKQLYIRKDLSECRKKDYRTTFKDIYKLTGKMPSALLKEAKKDQKAFINEDGLPEIKDIEDRAINTYFYDYYEYLKC